MTPLAQALSSALLHFIWQGIAMGFLLWIALFLLRRSSADVRYFVSCGALVLLALAPGVTALSLYEPRAAASLSWKTLSDPMTGQTKDIAAPAASALRLEEWILPAWGAGVALFALRLMWCWGHTSALRRTGAPAEDAFVAMVSRAAERIGVKRRVRVLMSSLAEVPSVVGWIRPVLLLPVSVATGISAEQLEALIAHELAHVRRHDYLVNLAQAVMETVLFYHPVVWWVSSRIRYERELCCDDAAVAALGDRATYARALARLEEVRLVRPSLAMGATRGPLYHRIERLLEGNGFQQGPSRLICAAGLLIGVACFAINMGWAESWQSPQRNSDFVTTESFFPLPPTSPVLVMPPMEFIVPTPAIPPIPPTPPLTPVYMFGEGVPMVFATLQTAAQRIDVPWILFLGNRVIVNGSSTDEAEAQAARQSAGNGDALWFRVGGKAYFTQDKAILDRMEEARQRRDSVDFREELSRNLAEKFAARFAQDAQRTEEIRARLEEAARRFSSGVPDVLREAVESGKAQPVK